MLCGGSFKPLMHILASDFFKTKSDDIYIIFIRYHENRFFGTKYLSGQVENCKWILCSRK